MAALICHASSSIFPIPSRKVRHIDEVSTITSLLHSKCNFLHEGKIFMCSYY